MDKKEKYEEKNKVIYWQYFGTSLQTFKWILEYYLTISIAYLGFKMCIQNALQITDIIKNNLHSRSFAFYFSPKKSATQTVSSWFYWIAPVAQLDRATDF